MWFHKWIKFRTTIISEIVFFHWIGLYERECKASRGNPEVDLVGSRLCGSGNKISKRPEDFENRDLSSAGISPGFIVLGAMQPRELLLAQRFASPILFSLHFLRFYLLLFFSFAPLPPPLASPIRHYIAPVYTALVRSSWAFFTIASLECGSAAGRPV